MRCSQAHIRILESRLRRRLDRLNASRIALLGAGRFTQELLGSLQDPARFAGATITGVIDESACPARPEIGGVPVTSLALAAPHDAIVVCTPMHEPGILRRATAGAYGDVPVIGLHTIESADLVTDALLLPETAWFGLDLPGLIENSGKRCTIASATGLPGFDEADVKPFLKDAEHQGADRLAWDGLGLFEFVRGSAACLTGRVDVDPERDRRTLLSLMEETIRIFESARRWFETPGSPSVVVVANGLLHHQRAVAEAALRSGNRAVAIEASCFPGLCHLEAGAAQTGARCAMARTVRDRLGGAVLTGAQRARTTAYLKSRSPHTERRTDSASQPAPQPIGAIREQLQIPKNNRVLLLLGQVCTDTTLVYDAPVVNDIPELARLASSVVAEFEGWTLVIKPHPKESTGLDPIAGRPYQHGAFERLRSDPIARAPHVRLVGPAEHNVYALMALADAGLAINSQSALEMAAMFARPVCLVGRAAFSEWGFTRNVSDRAALATTLASMLADPTFTADQHDRALQYVDHLVFENAIPADTTDPAQALLRDNEAARILFGGPQPTDPIREPKPLALETISA